MALSKALERNATVESLSLVDCGIGDEGAIAIAEGLRKNRTIHQLNLYHNRIGNQGATAIAKALECETTNLQSLLIDSNDIGLEGAKAIAKALKRNSTLRRLEVVEKGTFDAFDEEMAKMCWVWFIPPFFCTQSFWHPID